MFHGLLAHWGTCHSSPNPIEHVFFNSVVLHHTMPMHFLNMGCEQLVPADATTDGPTKGRGDLPCLAKQRKFHFPQTPSSSYLWPLGRRVTFFGLYQVSCDSSRHKPIWSPWTDSYSKEGSPPTPQSRCNNRSLGLTVATTDIVITLKNVLIMYRFVTNVKIVF